MIKKLKSGRTGRRRNLGTYANKAGAVERERQVQYLKRRGGG